MAFLTNLEQKLQSTAKICLRKSVDGGGRGVNEDVDVHAHPEHTNTKRVHHTLEPSSASEAYPVRWPALLIKVETIPSEPVPELST